MARKIKRRLIITGQIVCKTPLHVGGPEARTGVDLALSVNGAGEVYIPGTSLAGPLRAWCADVYGDGTANTLWGKQEGDVGHASFVLVEDAILSKDIATEIRDSVGIDRYSGTAAEHIKFNREILPAGAVLPLELTFDDKGDNEDGAKMLASLVQALKAGEIRLGASKSRGLGKVELQNVAVVERTLATREGILAALKGGTPKFSGDEALAKLHSGWQAEQRSRPLIEIRIDWQPVGPFMVKASADGAAVDTLPLMSEQEGRLRLVLPGSSTKGALRSQAERILSTVLRKPLDENAEFLDQLARFPLIETLFGARNTKDSEDGAEDDAPHVGLSPLGVDDCYSETSIDRKTWQHMLADKYGDAEKVDHDELTQWAGALPELKKANGTPYFDPATHVAIDRWTGGASDGALFSVLEPWGFEWQPLVLTIDPRRLARHRDDNCGDAGATRLAAIALLLLTLHDFANGEVPLGFSTNRGFGSVDVSQMTLAVPQADGNQPQWVRAILEALRPLNGPLLTNGTFTTGEAIHQALGATWKAYLDAQETSVAATTPEVTA